MGRLAGKVLYIANSRAAHQHCMCCRLADRLCALLFGYGRRGRRGPCPSSSMPVRTLKTVIMVVQIDSDG